MLLCTYFVYLYSFAHVELWHPFINRFDSRFSRVEIFPNPISLHFHQFLTRFNIGYLLMIKINKREKSSQNVKKHLIQFGFNWWVTQLNESGLYVSAFLWLCSLCFVFLLLNQSTLINHNYIRVSIVFK